MTPITPYPLAPIAQLRHDLARLWNPPGLRHRSQGTAPRPTTDVWVAGRLGVTRMSLADFERWR